MPFDAMTTVTVQVDPLQAMGITPVPEKVWLGYMGKMKKKYRRLVPLGVEWRSIRFQPGLGSSLPQHLQCALRSVHYADDKSSPPTAIVQLAERVARTIPEASFSLAYFYTDPILFAHYEVGDEIRKACLGIWDNGVTVAIAGPASGPGFWRRLFQWT